MRAKEITIIDCGIGNVGSIAHALDLLGGKYRVSSKRMEIERSEAYILPGVSAFAAAMDNLKRLGLVDVLGEQVLNKKKPFFGICVGMQVLAKDSLEEGYHDGLGWLDAHVVPMRPKGDLRIPHVGWNNVNSDRKSFFFQRVDEGAHFYFDHSFHMTCPVELVSATFEYGGAMISAIQKNNIFAVQFHPEKSQRQGLKVLRNYISFVNGS